MILAHSSAQSESDNIHKWDWSEVVDVASGKINRSIIDDVGPTERGGAELKRPEPALPPMLFLLPGSIGYTPGMATFAASLSEVASIVPIRYPDLRSILAGENTVAAMAKAAVDQIKRKQSTGDIRLLGHSLGGAVAFEVATQLLQSGRSVKFLGILDTSIARERRRYGATFVRLLRSTRANRLAAYRMACRALAKTTERIGCEVGLAKLLDTHGRHRRFQATSFRIKMELQETLRSRAFYAWLASPKRALPIAGTVFRCKRGGAPQALGWDDAFASLDVVQIAGGHIDLIAEPHLRTNRVLIEEALRQTYMETRFC